MVGGGRHDLAARRLTGLGVLAAVPTAAAGLSNWSDTIGGTRRVGLAHAVGNVAGLLLQTAAYWARRQGRHGTGVALGAAGLGAVAASGYLGGHLSFVRGVGVNRTAFEETSSDWVDVVALAAVPIGKPTRVHANGIPVVVRKNDQLHALSATELAVLTGAVDQLLPTAGLRALAGPSPAVAVNLHGRGPDSTRVLRALRPGVLLTHAHPEVPGPEWETDMHEVLRWCRLLEHAGIPTDPADLGLPRPATEPGTRSGGGAPRMRVRRPTVARAAVRRRRPRAGRDRVTGGADRQR